jgi:hypothetical protein
VSDGPSGTGSHPTLRAPGAGFRHVADAAPIPAHSPLQGESFEGLTDICAADPEGRREVDSPRGPTEPHNSPNPYDRTGQSSAWATMTLSPLKVTAGPSCSS